MSDRQTKKAAVGEVLASSKSTAFEQADTIVTRLASRKEVWLSVSVGDRIAYLQCCIDAITRIAPQWADAACTAKGVDPAAMLAGEEWLIGPAVTLANLRLLIQTLQTGSTPKVRSRNNQPIAQVFPDSWMERVLWWGFRGEVWMQPGSIARRLNSQSPTGKLALVLGAGNVSSIAPMDALYQLFAENAVVLVKMNPVNEYMGPILEVVFQSLRQDGFLEIVYGGAELGSYLCQHRSIDTIHVTGSHQTHDAIVWGSSDPQVQRQQDDRPPIAKPVTSELGCVTPVVVVPGDWSPAEIAFQARQVAGMVAHNASFNCAAAQVVVTAKSWAQRQEFLEQLQRELALTPPRHAYYPGAQQRYQAFLERYPQAIALQGTQRTQEVHLPWTLIPDVPAIKGEYALTQEAFCGVLAEVSLDAGDAGEFLERSVAFINDAVWGNLSCTLLIDPRTQKRWQAEFEAAIAQLRYGAIGVNVWSAVIYSLPALTWGAFPGNPLAAISSGCGVVHNAHLFEQPQKSVLYAPFRILPLPVWFARHRTLLPLAKQFTYFQANPTLGRLIGIILAAVRG